MELFLWHEYSKSIPSDIQEHLPELRKLARGVSSVAEIGLRNMLSTWALLLGLSESSKPDRSYLGIDLAMPPFLSIAKRLSKEGRISFQFRQKNDLNIRIRETDLLFIDSLHTYCHLTYELEKFSPKIKKFIALHDTSAPWGNSDDSSYSGDYSEYPLWIDRNKKGLWPAVEDFLTRHPEWKLEKRLMNYHGFTVLKRTFGAFSNRQPLHQPPSKTQ